VLELKGRTFHLQRIEVTVSDLLTSTDVRRVLQVVDSNGAPLLTTDFTNPRGDTPFWQSWLERDDVGYGHQSFSITFCKAKPGESHECLRPHPNECLIPDTALSYKPTQLLSSIRLTPIESISADSRQQPQTLTMLATVRFFLIRPQVETSIACRIKLYLGSGHLQFIS
jgi:hypothetical protein